MRSNKPILITGSPRSGTSWVGRIIGQEPFLHYVHEPFNISNPPCSCGVRFIYWFWYLTPANYETYEEHLAHTIYPAYSRAGLINAVSEVRRSRRIRPLLRYLMSHVTRGVIVKDPIAVFSAGMLAKLYEMNVVVLIRHPAAIVNSYKTLNWTHPFLHFMRQPELMEEHLAPFRHEIEDFAKNNHDIVDQAALLWKLIHYRIKKFQETHPDWVFIRYKDLALNPIAGYKKIFDQTGLRFSEPTRARIEAHQLQDSDPKNQDPYSVKQNPQFVLWKWRKGLTAEQITRIRKRVESVSQYFYADHEW